MRVRVVGPIEGRVEAPMGVGLAVLAIAVGVRSVAEMPPMAVVAIAVVAIALLAMALLLLSSAAVLIGRWALRSPFLGWPLVRLQGTITHGMWSLWQVVGVEVEGKNQALVRVGGRWDPDPTQRDRVVAAVATHQSVVARLHKLRSDRQ